MKIEDNRYDNDRITKMVKKIDVSWKDKSNKL